MTAVLIPEFELQSAQELADLLTEAETWRAVERLTTAHEHLKIEAWKLLSESQQAYLKELQKWKDHPVAQQFPPGVKVQRIGDPEELVGEVSHYWEAYGVDYVTFMVGPDVDWCRASFLKRV